MNEVLKKITNPKVSVIIAMHNAELYVSQCIESIRAQTLKDIEIICIDDFSTDNTANIIDTLKSTDERISLVRLDKNVGAGAARNIGLDLATGEYLSFLDADDVFELPMLEVAYNKASGNNLDVVIFKSIGFDNASGAEISMDWSIRRDLLPENDIFSASDVAKDFFHLSIWWAWDKLFKRTHVLAQGIRFQEIRTTNDLFFSVAVTITAKRISCIDDILARQRQNITGSLSSTRHLSYNCCLIALKEVQRFLEEKELYAKYIYDFQNFAVAFCLWHVSTIKSESFISLYDEIVMYLKSQNMDIQQFYYPHLHSFYTVLTTSTVIDYLLMLKEEVSSRNLDLIKNVSHLQFLLREKEHELARSLAVNNCLSAEVEAIRTSRSWAITRPLRAISTFIQNLARNG